MKLFRALLIVIPAGVMVWALLALLVLLTIHSCAQALTRS